MEIRENNDICIITPLSNNLNKYESKRLFDELKNLTKSAAIDLSYVSECTIDFIEELKKFASIKNIGVFNIPSDIFVLFNIMKIDRYASLFVSESDFETDSRQLINRQFTCI